MKNKKGSNVEIIVSFVLFVGSIFFIYILLQPSLKTENKPLDLESIKEKLNEVASDNLTTVSVNTVGTYNCVQLSGFFNSVPISDDKFVVITSSGLVNGGKQGSDLYVQSNGNNFFKIYDSPSLQSQIGSLNGCQQLSQNNYSFGFIKTEKKILDSKILSLISKYKTNYTGLKTDLGISNDTGFGISFVYSNSTTISTQEQTPTAVNIYSEQSVVEYLNKNSGIETGKLIVRVW